MQLFFFQGLLFDIEIIKNAFESGELDVAPFDFQEGYDFIIKKTAQGEWGTYALGSNFARRSTALEDDVIAMIEEEMVDLSTLLPAHPGRLDSLSLAGNEQLLLQPNGLLLDELAFQERVPLRLTFLSVRTLRSQLTRTSPAAWCLHFSHYA